MVQTRTEVTAQTKTSFGREASRDFGSIGALSLRPIFLPFHLPASACWSLRQPTYSLPRAYQNQAAPDAFLKPLSNSCGLPSTCIAFHLVLIHRNIPSPSSHDNAARPNQPGLNHSMLIARLRNFASAGMLDARSEAIYSLDSIFEIFLPLDVPFRQWLEIRQRLFVDFGKPAA
ncbi:uncharacterized protein CLUP02_03246 [Colletotrichum lupini]|uniref:Uncharacterized protein n=1 Tax=Colletotrichum lupini TaxID=145971 RepID=A0A9Q8SIG0_9PEZI|nr:uncharacterized protein CLUP02_03246 [Colletotrichum lupini]UQC77775.1 hypothetical protein CLUP02_03246 [Colletotrichum lupini]